MFEDVQAESGSPEMWKLVWITVKRPRPMRERFDKGRNECR